MSSFKENKAGQAEIIAHFAGCNFEPKLETYIDIDSYSKKIVTRAQRFEYWDNDELAGLVAIYCNDFKTKKSFITMVSVMTKYARQGIARRLLENGIKYCQQKGFKTISLAVRQNNFAAIHLYEDLGFIELGKQETFITMRLNLDKL